MYITVANWTVEQSWCWNTCFYTTWLMLIRHYTNRFRPTPSHLYHRHYFITALQKSKSLMSPKISLQIPNHWDKVETVFNFYATQVVLALQEQLVVHLFCKKHERTGVQLYLKFCFGSTELLQKAVLMTFAQQHFGCIMCHYSIGNLLQMNMRWNIF